MSQEYDPYHEYLNGNSDQGDKLDEEVKSFLDQTGSLEVPSFEKSRDDIWKLIDAETNEEEEEEEGKVVPLDPWRKLLTIAASIVLIFTVSTIFYIYGEDDVEKIVVSSKIGEIEKILLPDGSIATLNADSKLSYNEEWNREVTLEGEAFFEVMEGDKFSVNTNQGVVQVLGTSFNVYDREDTYVVSCRTGKVQVSISNNTSKEILTKGQEVSLESDTVKRRQITELNIGNWTKGEFYFDNRPVKEVFKELRRQYGIKIQAGKVGDKIFTGYFIKSDLEVALSMVCEPLNLSYEILDDQKVLIRSNE